jgi:hypothetical protein
MTTQGSNEDPSSSAQGAVSGEDGFSQGSSEGSSEGFISSDDAGGGGVAFAYRGEEVPPPPQAAIGRYRFDAPRLNHPPDPIMPFIAPPGQRKRRRDWPVLVFALVIAALALATCCIAGFALYASRAPFGQ